MELKPIATILALAMAVGADAAPLRWSSANTPDGATIELFHFDEGAGWDSSNSVDVPGVSNDGMSLNAADPAADLWAANPGWMTRPFGYALNNVKSIIRDEAGAMTGYSLYHGDYVARSQSELPIDWRTLPGVTVSFWMRDEIATPTENKIVYLGHDGWRDQQVQFGYRPGWSNAGRYGTDGVFPTGAAAGWYTAVAPQIHDGTWHHVAIVWDNAADIGTLYLDNERVRLGVDDQGAPLYTWNTAGGLDAVATEFWYLGNGGNEGFGGQIDELLIQGHVMSDFSTGLNAQVPEPTALSLAAAPFLALLARRRSGARVDRRGA